MESERLLRLRGYLCTAPLFVSLIKDNIPPFIFLLARSSRRSTQPRRLKISVSKPGQRTAKSRLLVK
jgi:hypothetical protein